MKPNGQEIEKMKKRLNMALDLLLIFASVQVLLYMYKGYLVYSRAAASRFEKSLLLETMTVHRWKKIS